MIAPKMSKKVNIRKVDQNEARSRQENLINNMMDLSITNKSILGETMSELDN